MKKWFLSLVATMLLVLNVSAPIASAQDTNWEEVLTQINEKSQEFVPMAGDLKVSLDVPDVVTGALTGEFKYNLDPFALELSGNLDGVMKSADAEGQAVDMPLTFNGSAIIVDNMLYLNDGSKWISQDFSEPIQQFEQAFNEAMAQQTEVMQANTDLTLKYFDMAESDSEYVMTMKQDIDPAQFWADIEQTVDMDQIMEETFEQSIKESEATTGVTLSDEEIAQLRAQSEQVTEMMKQLVPEIIDNVEMRYDKETLLLSYMAYTVNLTAEDLQKVANEIDPESAGNIPPVNISLVMELNITETGTAFDIVAPADAQSLEEAEESVESDMESIESDIESVQEEVESTTEEVSEESEE